jgi:DNA-binding transcriptional MerR regulator
MNEPPYPAACSLMVVRVTAIGAAAHSLEAAARLGGVHPEMLRHYCRIGLLGAARTQPGIEPVFDDDAVFELRRLEHYRRQHGLDRRSLRLLCHLWREIERLQAEVRFLRGP